MTEPYAFTTIASAIGIFLAGGVVGFFVNRASYLKGFNDGRLYENAVLNKRIYNLDPAATELTKEELSALAGIRRKG